MQIRTFVTAATVLMLIGGGPALARHHHHHHHKKQLDPTNPKQGSVNGPASVGAGTGENKPSATGGQPGGPAGQQ